MCQRHDACSLGLLSLPSGDCEDLPTHQAQIGLLDPRQRQARAHPGRLRVRPRRPHFGDHLIECYADRVVYPYGVRWDEDEDAGDPDADRFAVVSEVDRRLLTQLFGEETARERCGCDPAPEEDV